MTSCQAASSATTASRRLMVLRRQRRYRSLAARGLPTSDRVDIAPIREHVRNLQEQGMGYRRIAAHAGLPLATINNLLYKPRRRWVQGATARALLAVQLDTAPAARICGVGTLRRLRGLVALGWTVTALAARIGWTMNNLRDLIAEDEATCRVTTATARKVAALYDDLWDQPPPARTRHQRGAITGAKRRAKARGWVSPLAWDDDTIDDPQARPNVRGARVEPPCSRPTPARPRYGIDAVDPDEMF